MKPFIVSLILVCTVLGLAVVSYKKRHFITEKYEVLFYTSEETFTPTKVIPVPEVICHSGGKINGLKTNSIEAVKLNYQEGKRFFEIDFCATKDGHLVAFHDWSNSKATLSGIEHQPGTLSLVEFKNAKHYGKYTCTTADEMLNWFESHADAYLITDIKEKNNVQWLAKLSQKHPKAMPQIIPQAYSFREYEEIKNLGYENVILTIYRLKHSNAAIAKFCNNKKLWALTVPWDRAYNGIVSSVKSSNVKVLAHGIDEEYIQNILRSKGVHGFYK